MPIYHFEVRRCGETYSDPEGIEFNDLSGAWKEATTAAGQMIKDLDGQLKPGSTCSIEVQDEFFNSIQTVNISVTKPKF